MPPEETQCSQHFIAHEQSIEQSKADIANIYGILNGLPQDVKHILNAVADLTKFIGKLDDKYVSREYMTLMIATSEDKIKLWVLMGTGTALSGALMMAYYITHLLK